MRKFFKLYFLLLLTGFFFVTNLSAQIVNIINNNTSNSYRGISIFKNNIWVSGTNGTVGHSNDYGNTWQYQQLKGFEKIDFRDIHVFDENNIIVMGIASPAYILRSNDGGQNWKIVYHNNDPKIFLDAFYFQKNKGICIGDPLTQTPFTITTNDFGKTWKEESIFSTPLADGEAFYAASGSNIVIHKNKYYAVTGGKQSRLLSKKNSKKLPTMQGLKMTGTNSIAQWENHLFIVGGDYENLTRNDSIAAFSGNAGKTWTISKTQPSGYKSCVIYINKNTLVACGLTGVDISHDGGNTWKKISNHSFNSCVYNPQDHSIYFCGVKGNIGKLSLTL